MNVMNNFKLITKLTLIGYSHKHRLTITSHVVTKNPLKLLSNENIIVEDLGQKYLLILEPSNITHDTFSR